MVKRESDMDNRRTYPYQIFYADTDAGGVVYYAQYLRMFEQVRALYIQDFGLSLSELAGQGYLFACRRAEVDYHTPAVLDDRLDIHIAIQEFGHSFIDFVYHVECPTRPNKDGSPLSIAHGYTKMACCKRVGEKVKPQRIPKWVLQRLTEAPDSC